MAEPHEPRLQESSRPLTWFFTSDLILGVSVSWKARVAAYVREPDALSLRDGGAKQRAIDDATPFLQHEGWTELEFEGVEWDDDPQSGRAFYIYFRGVPPEGRSSIEEIGVQCIQFSPPHSTG